MIDGVHFAESCCVVALGIGSTGSSIRWRWWKAHGERTLVTDLLVDLRERGLDVTRSMLVGIDGSRRCARLWSMCSITR